MKERNIKRKEKMRDVMDDGVCQNQRVLSCKLCRFCSFKSLYIGLKLDFGLYLSVAKIFYFYLINYNLIFVQFPILHLLFNHFHNIDQNLTRV